MGVKEFKRRYSDVYIYYTERVYEYVRFVRRRIFFVTFFFFATGCNTRTFFFFTFPMMRIYIYHTVADVLRISDYRKIRENFQSAKLSA